MDQFSKNSEINRTRISLAASNREDRALVDAVSRWQARGVFAFMLVLLVLCWQAFSTLGPTPHTELPADDRVVSEQKTDLAADNGDAETPPTIQYRSRAVVGVPTSPTEDAPTPKPAAVEVDTSLQIAESATDPPVSINEPIAEPQVIEEEILSDESSPDGGLANQDSEDDETWPIGAITETDGVTAAPFCLETLGEYEELAANHRGLILGFDGERFVQIGRSLNPRYARWEEIKRDDLQGYAARMAPLPRTPSTRALLDRLHQQFPASANRPFQLLLALPVAYDQEILRAQRQYLSQTGTQPTGRVVTVVRFMQTDPVDGMSAFRVLRVREQQQ